MTMNGQPGVPLLGQQKPTHAVPQLATFVRHTDEHGLVALTDGGLPRTAMVDAEQLCEMLSDAVGKRIRAELVRAGLAKPDA